MKRTVFCLLTLVMAFCHTDAQQRQGQAVPEVFTVVFATSDDGFLNVRSQPSNSGTVKAKLLMPYHGLGNGVLLQRGEKWSKVKVGIVTGWVYNKYMGCQTWYEGTGRTILVAKRADTPVYVDNDYSDEGGGYNVFTTVRKGTILADQYELTDGYYVLKTGHDYLFIKQADAVEKPI